MNRGRRYHQTPMAKIRPSLNRWVFLGLIVILIISVAELTVYFVHSHQNWEMRELLAEQHQAALSNETGEIVATAAPTTIMPSPAQTAADKHQGPAKITDRKFFTVVGLTQEGMKPFVRQNKDTIGWIKIEDIVDQPIVYRDNTYYLTHDFYGKKNTSGAIFLDMNHPLQKNAQNLLLWGHNMKDGSMFGRLATYLHNNFLHSHNIIYLETCFESYTYIIFAVNKVSIDYRSKDYLAFWMHPTFSDAASFDTYIDDVYKQSLYTRYLDVDYSDALLTLGTCYGDERLVLIARRQRENETDADIQHAMLGLYNNLNP